MEDLKRKKDIFLNFTQDVQVICKPLFEAFGINYYDYARFYPDNSCFMIFSDSDWACTFLDEKYQAPNGLIPEGMNPWHSYIPGEMLSLANNVFQHGNGITFLKKSAQYDEIINIAAPSSERFIENLFAKEENFFSKFFLYFTHKANAIMRHLEKNRLILPNPPSDLIVSNEDKFKKFFEILGEEKQIFDATAHDKWELLTQKEKLCMKYFLEGLSAKQIARMMGISYRTVEHHIYSVRTKLNCPSSLQLLSTLKSIRQYL